MTTTTPNTISATAPNRRNIDSVDHSDTHPDAQQPAGWHQFDMETTELKGRRLRVLTDLPTDDAAVPQDQLPRGITDVIADEDDVTVNLTVRVHPVDDPTTIAYIRYDQLALYDQP